jgi:predicted protein tyrosine phosphatase
MKRIFFNGKVLRSKCSIFIFVMKKKHEKMIDKFPLETIRKQIIILNIPDEYQ